MEAAGWGLGAGFGASAGSKLPKPIWPVGGGGTPDFGLGQMQSSGREKAQASKRKILGEMLPKRRSINWNDLPYIAFVLVVNSKTYSSFCFGRSFKFTR